MVFDGMASGWPPLLEFDGVASARRLTIDEWLQLDEDEPGELVDGRLVW
jgi:hypothetical protein